MTLIGSFARTAIAVACVAVGQGEMVAGQNTGTFKGKYFKDGSTKNATFRYKIENRKVNVTKNHENKSIGSQSKSWGAINERGGVDLSEDKSHVTVQATYTITLDDDQATADFVRAVEVARNKHQLSQQWQWGSRIWGSTPQGEVMTTMRQWRQRTDSTSQVPLAEYLRTMTSSRAKAKGWKVMKRVAKTKLAAARTANFKKDMQAMQRLTKGRSDSAGQKKAFDQFAGTVDFRGAKVMDAVALKRFFDFSESNVDTPTPEMCAELSCAHSAGGRQRRFENNTSAFALTLSEFQNLMTTRDTFYAAAGDDALMDAQELRVALRKLGRTNVLGLEGKAWYKGAWCTKLMARVTNAQKMTYREFVRMLHAQELFTAIENGQISATEADKTAIKNMLTPPRRSFRRSGRLHRLSRRNLIHTPGYGSDEPSDDQEPRDAYNSADRQDSSEESEESEPKQKKQKTNKKGKQTTRRSSSSGYFCCIPMDFCDCGPCDMCES